MKFIIQYRDLSVADESVVNNDIPDLVWPKGYRDVFDPVEMQCLALIRRQKDNVTTMKLVLRSHEAE